MTDLSLKIRELENSSRNLLRVIHYGCESWYSVKDRPVAISCITIVDFSTGATVAFSLTDHSDDLEKKLLEAYYKHIRELPDAKYIHWNMHSSDYGFEAIDKRYKYLLGQDPPYIVPQESRFDLDSFIEFRYGSDYVDHPKLVNLTSLNQLDKRFWLTGKEEAEKFDSREYGDIKRSITEKARHINHLAKLFLRGTLTTKYSGSRVDFASEKVDAVKIVEKIGERFKTISRQLRNRYGGRTTIEIKDEYDVQDLFHALLRLFFDDVRAEEWTPSYAGGNKRTDFLIPTHSIAIELKHSRSSMTSKDLGDQLVIDIANYQKHPSTRIIICLVFDYEGHINNPMGIEKDLTSVQGNHSIITRILT